MKRFCCETPALRPSAQESLLPPMLEQVCSGLITVPGNRYKDLCRTASYRDDHFAGPDCQYILGRRRGTYRILVHDPIVVVVNTLLPAEKVTVMFGLSPMKSSVLALSAV